MCYMFNVSLCHVIYLSLVLPSLVFFSFLLFLGSQSAQNPCQDKLTEHYYLEYLQDICIILRKPHKTTSLSIITICTTAVKDTT